MALSYISIFLHVIKQKDILLATLTSLIPLIISGNWYYSLPTILTLAIKAIFYFIEVKLMDPVILEYTNASNLCRWHRKTYGPNDWNSQANIGPYECFKDGGGYIDGKIYVSCLAKDPKLRLYGPTNDIKRIIDLSAQITNISDGIKCRDISKGGGFANYLNPVPFASEFIGEANFLTIKKSLDTFLKAEDHCKQNGLPWRTGFVFGGISGTGKTTCATAIAGYCDFELIRFKSDYFSGEPKDRTSFKKSVILLDEIDMMLIASKTNVFENHTSNISSEEVILRIFDFLDNKIDGCVVVATSNHIDQVDPRIVRPGRVGQTLIFDLLSSDNIRQLLYRYYPNNKKKINKVKAFTPLKLNQLIHEHVLPNLYDIDDCLNSLTTR